MPLYHLEVPVYVVFEVTAEYEAEARSRLNDELGNIDVTIATEPSDITVISAGINATPPAVLLHIADEPNTGR